MNSNSLPAVPTVDVPDIGPDFSAPFFQGLQVLASYVLAAAARVRGCSRRAVGKRPRVCRALRQTAPSRRCAVRLPLAVRHR